MWPSAAYFLCMFAFPEFRLSKSREGSMPSLFWAMGFLGFLFQSGLGGAGGAEGVGELNPTALAYSSD